MRFLFLTAAYGCRQLLSQCAEVRVSVLFPPPPQCRTVIGTVFVHRRNPAVLEPDEERYTSVLRIDACDRNDQIVCPFDPFDGSVPFSGIFAICNKVFLHRKMLVGAVPIHMAFV